MNPNQKEPEIINIGDDPPIIHYEVLDSTNTEAMRLGAGDTPNLTVVTADYQTAGRGKLQSKWVMPAGEGILLTILMREIPADVEFSRLTLRTGWVLAEWLRAKTGLDVQVKPPNDILIDGKKVCGILSEARWRGDQLLFAVVGVGMNINVQKFPPELSTLR